MRTVRQVKGQGSSYKDLLQALSSFLQSFLQPVELSSRICNVSCDFIRTVVEDSVETNHPQTRLHQLGVETTCRNRTGPKIKPDAYLQEKSISITHMALFGPYSNITPAH